jgi:hypothetical protein
MFGLRWLCKVLLRSTHVLALHDAADGQRIGNAGAYLRTIIANKAREKFPGEQGRAVAPGAGDQILLASAKASASLDRTEDDERHKRFVAIREE